MRVRGTGRWTRIALLSMALGGLQACGGGGGLGDQTDTSTEQYALAISPDGRAVASGGTFVVTRYGGITPYGYSGTDPNTGTSVPTDPTGGSSSDNTGPVEDVPPDSPADTGNSDTGSNAPADESNAGEGDLNRHNRNRHALSARASAPATLPTGRRRGFRAAHTYTAAQAATAATSARGQALAARNNYVYAGEDLNGRLWFANAQTGQSQGSKSLGQIVYALAYSPDGTLLAAGCQDQILRLLDAQSGTIRLELKGHTDRISGVAFAPDSKRVASAGYNDHTVRLWDAATGTLQNTLSTGTFGATAVAFSPDGKTVAGGVGNGDVIVWDAQSGAVLHTLTGHKYAVWSVAFSPDGKSLASGSADNTVNIYDTNTGAVNLTLTGHTGFVFGVRFAPDGQTLATGSADRTVRLWDARTGAQMRTLNAPESVQAVEYTPDSLNVVAAGVGGSIRAYGLSAGQPIWDQRVK